MYFSYVTVPGVKKKEVLSPKMELEANSVEKACKAFFTRDYLRKRSYTKSVGFFFADRVQSQHPSSSPIPRLHSAVKIREASSRIILLFVQSPIGDKLRQFILFPIFL